MIDAKRLLDVVVGAISRPGSGGGPQGGEQGGFLQGAVETIGRMGSEANRQLGQAAQQVTGGRSGAEIAQQAKDFMNRNPGLAEAALMSVAGILLGSRGGRGIARGAAALGGLAVVGGLAYQAFRNYQGGKPLLDGVAGGAPGASAPDGPASGPGAGTASAGTASLPGPAAFDPAQVSEDDALLFARAMVAAAAADGRMDDAERTRIVAALSQAGIDADATGWLERELSQPATVEELSDPVQTPEKAAQVYAAARVAVEPDTMQEREFLRQLAESLDLDPQLRAHIDAAAAGMRAE
jgi:uncharacterized membrane protein YebE (DUF533 family)